MARESTEKPEVFCMMRQDDLPKPHVPSQMLLCDSCKKKCWCDNNLRLIAASTQFRMCMQCTVAYAKALDA